MAVHPVLGSIPRCCNASCWPDLASVASGRNQGKYLSDARQEAAREYKPLLDEYVLSECEGNMMLEFQMSLSLDLFDMFEELEV